MKKFLALFVVVLLLAFAGSALAMAPYGDLSHIDQVDDEDEPTVTPPTSSDVPVASPDLSPDVSGDVTSGDTTSGDTSGGETSGDQSGGETSGDQSGGETSGDQSGGDTSGGDTRPSDNPMISALQTPPAVFAVLQNNPALFSAILGFFGLGADVQLISNEDVTFTNPIETAAAQSALAALFGTSRVVLFVLPRMSAPTPGILVIPTPPALLSLMRGRRRPWITMTRAGRNAVVAIAADEDGDALTTGTSAENGDDAVFLDANGNILDDIPETGDVFAALNFKDANTDYDPIVSEAAEDQQGGSSGGDTSGGDTSGGDTSGGDTSGGDTSGGDTSGGDSPSGGDTSGGDNTEEPGTVGSSGGGCDAGFSALALAVLGGFVISRKK